MSIVIKPRPPRQSLLIVAHGDGGDAPQDTATRRLAAELGARLALPVDWCTLRRPETIAAARVLLPLDSEVVVYPYFMSEGLFVREKLPERLRAGGFAAWRQLPPFGRDPALVDHLEHRLDRFAKSLARARTDMKTLLIAHGSASGDAASRLAAEAMVEALRGRGFSDVAAAYIEEEPFYDAAIREAEPEAVVGLFVTSGTHAVNDVAAVVAEVPSVKAHVLAVGLDEAVTDIVVSSLRSALGPEIMQFVREPE